MSGNSGDGTTISNYTPSFTLNVRSMIIITVAKSVTLDMINIDNYGLLGGPRIANPVSASLLGFPTGCRAYERQTCIEISDLGNII